MRMRRKVVHNLDILLTYEIEESIVTLSDVENIEECRKFGGKFRPVLGSAYIGNNGHTKHGPPRREGMPAIFRYPRVS